MPEDNVTLLIDIERELDEDEDEEANVEMSDPNLAFEPFDLVLARA